MAICNISNALLSTHPRVRFFERQLSRSLVQLSTIDNQEDEEVSSAAAAAECNCHPLMQDCGRAKSVGEIGSFFPNMWHQKIIQRGRNGSETRAPRSRIDKTLCISMISTVICRNNFQTFPFTCAYTMNEAS
jgi:hypothetical protein